MVEFSNLVVVAIAPVSKKLAAKYTYPGTAYLLDSEKYTYLGTYLQYVLDSEKKGSDMLFCYHDIFFMIFQEIMAV